MRNCCFAISAFILSLLSASIASQELPADCEGQCVSANSWALGVAVGFGEYSNPLAQRSDKNIAFLPSFYYYGERFYVENTTVGYTFFENDKWSLDVKGSFNQDGLYFRDTTLDSVLSSTSLKIGKKPNGVRPSPSDEFVQPFDVDRDLSYMAGFSGQYFIDETVSISADVMSDVTGVHDGQQYGVALDKYWQWSNLRVGARVGLVFRSSKVNDYYYGVNQSEFPIHDVEYQAGSGSNYAIGASASYALSKHFSIIGRANYKWLSNEISSSPLINEDYTTFYFIGIAGHIGSE